MQIDSFFFSFLYERISKEIKKYHIVTSLERERSCDHDMDGASWQLLLLLLLLLLWERNLDSWGNWATEWAPPSQHQTHCTVNNFNGLDLIYRSGPLPIKLHSFFFFFFFVPCCHNFQFLFVLNFEFSNLLVHTLILLCFWNWQNPI